MNYNGLCKLMKIEKISYKIFRSFVILIILLSFGCDRPEPASEVDNASLEENLEEVDLEPKPMTLPIVAPAPIIDKSSRVTILGYHQISDKSSPSEMRISVGKFRSQMQALRDAGIKVTACVDKVAASGGYMMACVCNKIVSSPFAIIGSIGVVAAIPNFHKVLKKNNVDYELHTAGEYKRTITMFGETTPAGRKKFKEHLQKRILS